RVHVGRGLARSGEKRHGLLTSSLWLGRSFRSAAKGSTPLGLDGTTFATVSTIIQARPVPVDHIGVMCFRLRVCAGSAAGHTPTVVRLRTTGVPSVDAGAAARRGSSHARSVC